jgi:N-glycosidase YbiA
LPKYLKDVRDTLEIREAKEVKEQEESKEAKESKEEKQAKQAEPAPNNPLIKPIPSDQVKPIKQDREEEPRPLDKRDWNEMKAAIESGKPDAISKIKRFLPRFGYFPGGATTLGNRTLLEVSEAATGLSSAQKQDIRDLLYSVLFYDSKQPFYEFTNFYRAPITIDGVTWSSLEAYYQAQKFNYNGASAAAKAKYQKLVKQALTQDPYEAFKGTKVLAPKTGKLVRDSKTKKFIDDPDIDPNWQNRSLDTMRKALEAKFTQNRALRELLLSTGDLGLIEAAGKNDNFFGNGEDGQGKNWLGKLLVETRKKLLKGEI